MDAIENSHQTCRICSFSGDSPVYKVREMMYGLRDEFCYFQCAKCQCLQISQFPSDMSPYYPKDYFSLSQSPESLYSNPLVSWARRARDSYSILNEGIWGRLIRLFYPECLDMASLSGLKLTRKKRIVDVGCGTGFLLYYLQEAGFESLLGVEPHIDADIKYPNGLIIKKARVHELDEEQDIIMFHHSFEHLPNPIETLDAVYRLMSSGGICMIRIPLVSSEAWRKYGVHWMQLDAPRHFFLYSIKSLKILAEKTKFKIRKIIYDSNESQFWGSQQYLNDIPLLAEKSYARNPAKSIFSKTEIENYKKMAHILNVDSQGDQAAIYMVKE
jgi:SAM-dependent methyltransferase